MSPVSAQITPCLIENSWSFYPHMGVGKCQTTPASGHLIKLKRYPIPGSIWTPISHFRITFPGSSGSGVHAHRKWRFKRLFNENNDFNRDLTMQFSAILWASFFGIYYSRVFGRIGLKMPLAARYRIHVGEIGFLGVLSGFWAVGNNLYLRVRACANFVENVFWEISPTRKNIYRIFPWAVKKTSMEFFLAVTIFPGNYSVSYTHLTLPTKRIV